MKSQACTARRRHFFARKYTVVTSSSACTGGSACVCAGDKYGAPSKLGMPQGEAPYGVSHRRGRYSGPGRSHARDPCRPEAISGFPYFSYHFLRARSLAQARFNFSWEALFSSASPSPRSTGLPVEGHPLTTVTQTCGRK